MFAGPFVRCAAPWTIVSELAMVRTLASVLFPVSTYRAAHMRLLLIFQLYFFVRLRSRVRKTAEVTIRAASGKIVPANVLWHL